MYAKSIPIFKNVRLKIQDCIMPSIDPWCVTFDPHC